MEEITLNLVRKRWIILLSLIFVLAAPLPWLHCFDSCSIGPGPFIIPGFHWMTFLGGESFYFMFAYLIIFSIFFLIVYLFFKIDKKKFFIISAVVGIILVVMINVVAPDIYKSISSAQKRNFQDKVQEQQKACDLTSLGLQRSYVLDNVAKPSLTGYNNPLEKKTVKNYIFMNKKQFFFLQSFLATNDQTETYERIEQVLRGGHSGEDYYVVWKIDDLTPALLSQFFKEHEKLTFERCDGYASSTVLCYHNDVLVLKACGMRREISSWGGHGFLKNTWIKVNGWSISSLEISNDYIKNQ